MFTVCLHFTFSQYHVYGETRDVSYSQLTQLENAFHLGIGGGPSQSESIVGVLQYAILLDKLSRGLGGEIA